MKDKAKKDISGIDSGNNPLTKDQAKKYIIDSLTGQRFDSEKLEEAIVCLNNKAPEELETLKNNILNITNDVIDCNIVSESLLDYLSLEEKASEMMPRIYNHIQSCQKCLDEFEFLQETLDQSNEWEQFALKIKKAELPSGLILAKTVWKWIKGNSRIAISDIEIRKKKQIGNWVLSPFDKALMAGIHLDDVTKPPIVLTTTLPDNMAEIKLLVNPNYRSIDNKESWFVHLELDPNSLFSRLFVSIEYRGILIIKNELRKDRPVAIPLDPPIGTKYIFTFEWKTPDGKWEKHAIELPLYCEESRE